MLIREYVAEQQKDVCDFGICIWQFIEREVAFVSFLDNVCDSHQVSSSKDLFECKTNNFMTLCHIKSDYLSLSMTP